MEMHELIDERTANLVVNALALGLPLLGLAVGVVVGKMRGRLRSGTLRGLALGCLGVLNWLLWHLYNAVTSHFGLDTVRNLMANLGLFVVIGIVVGILVGRWRCANVMREARDARASQKESNIG